MFDNPVYGMETTQIKLKLTEDKFILDQLSKKKLWRGKKSDRYVVLQFDGKEFQFRPGKTSTLPRNIANGLIRSSAIIAEEDALSGDPAPFLEKVAEYELGSEDPTVTPTTCPVCKVEYNTLQRLARHLMRAKDEAHMAHRDEDEDEKPESAENELAEADGAEEVGVEE